MSDSDQNPSTSNEFTIRNAETREKYEAARNIRLLKQEIETWKQKYEDIRPKYEYSREVLARYRAQIAKDTATIKSLNEEISTMKRPWSNLR